MICSVTSKKIQNQSYQHHGGTLYTPLLLHDNGLGSPHIGKNIYLHTIQMVLGYLFPVDATLGTYQCYQGVILKFMHNQKRMWNPLKTSAVQKIDFSI